MTLDVRSIRILFQMHGNFYCRNDHVNQQQHPEKRARMIVILTNLEFETAVVFEETEVIFGKNPNIHIIR